MAKKNSKSKKNTQNIQSKKSIVLAEKNKSMFPVIIGIACLAILVAVGVFYFSGDQDPEVIAKAVTDEQVSDTLVKNISYPVSDFSDGHARHFEYAHGDIKIRYFILKSSDGIIRAAFDACDVCWPANKGYYQDGDQMVCRNCGRRFPSVRINEVKGGCNPAPLKRNISQDQLVIRIDDILEGKQYFDFSGKA